MITPHLSFWLVWHTTLLSFVGAGGGKGPKANLVNKEPTLTREREKRGNPPDSPSLSSTTQTKLYLNFAKDPSHSSIQKNIRGLYSSTFWGRKKPDFNDDLFEKSVEFLANKTDDLGWSLSFCLVGGPLSLTVGGKRASSSSFHSLTMKKKEDLLMLSPAQPFLFPMWPCPTYFFPLSVLLVSLISASFLFFFTHRRKKGTSLEKGREQVSSCKKRRRSYFMPGRDLWLTRQNNIFFFFPLFRQVFFVDPGYGPINFAFPVFLPHFWVKLFLSPFYNPSFFSPWLGEKG